MCSAGVLGTVLGVRTGALWTEQCPVHTHVHLTAVHVHNGRRRARVPLLRQGQQTQPGKIRTSS